MKSVAVVGTIVYDQILTARESIDLKRCNKMNLNASLGGSMHNVAWNLSTLQIETHFVTKFGNDSLAMEAEMNLQKRGCFVYGTALNKPTPHFYLLQDSANHLLFCTIDEDFFFHAEDLLYCDAIRHCAYGVIDQEDTGVLKRLLTNTPQTRWIMSGSLPPNELVGQFEGIILNEKEFLTSCQESEPEEMIHQCINKGCSWMIVTRASKGATLYVRQGAYDYPTHETLPDQNSLGCGDAFISGVLYALCSDKSIQEATTLGIKASSLVMQTPSALSDSILQCK